MYYILYNPISGNGRGGEELDHIKSLTSADAKIFKVTDIEDYVSFVSSLSENDVLVISGGDGTINRFANNIADACIKCPIYYYASGTGNDFLCDIGNEKRGELIHLNEYIENLPTVEVDGKTYRFLNGVGYGIDGYCCEEGDKLRAASTKPVDYTAIAIKGLLFKYKPKNATITVDGVTKKYKKVWIAPTMNGRCYGGGMIPTPAQDRLNPERTLSLMVFHGSDKLRTLMIFPSIFKGEHVKNTKYVDVLVGKEITVKYDAPSPLQIDGETIVGISEYTARSSALVTSKK
jgi:diacylglycerol kinase family enzyme